MQHELHPREVEVVVGLVVLDLDRVLAQLEAVLDPPLMLRDALLTLAGVLYVAQPHGENRIPRDATLGVLFKTGEEAGLAQILASTYSPAVGLSFLTVSILFIPCAATVAANV